MGAQKNRRIETFLLSTHNLWEHSGSMVECLTRDRRAAGLSLTDVTVLWSLSKTHLSLLSTGSTQEDPSLFLNERLLMGRKESNQTNKQNPQHFVSTYNISSVASQNLVTLIFTQTTFCLRGEYQAHGAYSI